MTSTIISDMIPQAMDQIGFVFFGKDEKGKPQTQKEPINKVYKGYISSLGASLVQSGLLPTLAIFSAEDSGDEGDRRILLRILTNMMVAKWPDHYKMLEKESKDQTERRLLVYAAENKTDLVLQRQIRRHLSDASVALKLALRTYNLQKP